MATLKRLGILKPDASDFGLAPSQGNLLFSAIGHDYLTSVVASNTLATTGNICVYVLPGGSTVTTNPAEYGLITYNLSLSGYNTYETFRFAVNQNDEVWVAGSEGISYYIQGIEQAV